MSCSAREGLILAKSSGSVLFAKMSILVCWDERVKFQGHIILKNSLSHTLLLIMLIISVKFYENHTKKCTVDYITNLDRQMI